MFPCFDEPDMKAVFEISIARSKKYHTLANMDVRLTAEEYEQHFTYFIYVALAFNYSV